ncbi:hypothetical protein GOP47_0015320 [Adiantum capillus-veneris]|uniref:Uncharacterized protein n=1 Tax=Adiantum capillus-veneris TaxID=13818 RepID=A0A9D4UJG6_ADICA|nr:hypothetical protein GOP47_0015320 [Adiantum capillus-veneris]
MGPFEEPHRGDESIHFLFNSLCNGMEVEIQSAYETLLALLQNVLQHRSALSKRRCDCCRSQLYSKSKVLPKPALIRPFKARLAPWAYPSIWNGNINAVDAGLAIPNSLVKHLDS